MLALSFAAEAEISRGIEYVMAQAMRLEGGCASQSRASSGHGTRRARRQHRVNSSASEPGSEGRRRSDFTGDLCAGSRLHATEMACGRARTPCDKRPPGASDLDVDRLLDWPKEHIDVGTRRPPSLVKTLRTATVRLFATTSVGRAMGRRSAQGGEQRSLRLARRFT